MRVLISGGSGFIGKALEAKLRSEGHEILTTSRRPGSGAITWQVETEAAPSSAIIGQDVIVHLAGESIASGRWSDERKARIRDSRVLGTRNLVEGIVQSKHRPSVLICASAVGFYGDRGDEVLTESSPPGKGFLPEVCIEWEREAKRAEGLGIRVVNLRTGLVLGRDGGALEKMLPPFRLGVGGRLGGGDQWWPWIHIRDVEGIVSHVLNTPSVKGPVNLASPGIVRNREFTNALASAVDRPAILPVPVLALRLLFGEMADILLMSQRVTPTAVLNSGYTFKFGSLGEALEDLIG